ncbi:hypothetical protein ALC57_08803 [Trachymyrmex cornetzi]|uniref:DUF8207 domain-containing protein n=1 Tax=Trachymyrmex cornetzi TaxID=471704 RepID=A0A151J6M0_9HYME|nr:hypothetical protein ALC57_08803 [Trachymyrmex cornetzi]
MLLYEFIHLTHNFQNLIDYLDEKKVIRTKTQCPLCGNNIMYDYNESSLMHCGKHYYKRTGKKRRQRKTCNFKVSVMHLSWFAKAHIDITTFSYFLMINSPRLQLLRVECNMSLQTAIDWTNFCRELMTQWIYSNNVQIGGPNKIVEIDEVKIGRRKCHKGRIITGQWVFGGIERESKKIFIVPVEDRKSETLIPIIRRYIKPGSILLENVFEMTEVSLATKVQNQLQTSEGREALRANLGPLGQKYVEAVLRGAQDKEIGIDHVYGVYLHKDGLMFCNKRFDVDDAGNIIIDGVRYAGTPGLYELIFKRMPDDALYTEYDMHKYKSMLLMTSSHKQKHHSQGRLLSNRGYKYKYIIATLMLVTPKKQSKKSGKGLPYAMTLYDNTIDYVHWDDPNELVDRLRLLDVSHRACNNAHDNEMLSITEELRETVLL